MLPIFNKVKYTAKKAAVYVLNNILTMINITRDILIFLGYFLY